MEYGCKPAGQTRAASPHIAAIQPACVKRRYAACQRGPTAPRSPQNERARRLCVVPICLTTRMRRRRHPLPRRRSRHSRHRRRSLADPPLLLPADLEASCLIPLSSPSSLQTPIARTALNQRQGQLRRCAPKCKIFLKFGEDVSPTEFVGI